MVGFGSDRPTLPSSPGLRTSVSLNPTNSQRFYRLCWTGVSLPQDPTTVAPVLDPTVTSDVGTGTAFLYSGAEPIQTGVSAGAIELKRAVVLRGQVVQANGEPLPGVTLSVVGHSEYGQTISRADGHFDLVANDGGSLTVDYRKTGFIDACRVISVPKQDFFTLPTVTLLQEENGKTIVPLKGATEAQLAQASVVSDERGDRQAAIFFPQGVSAAVIPALGQTQAVEQVSLKLTEYTVGSNGLSAMPLELPSGVAYTYAVNLGSDEARLRVGGQDVLFDKPVYFYVQNFLGFPAGNSCAVGICRSRHRRLGACS